MTIQAISLEPDLSATNARRIDSSTTDPSPFAAELSRIQEAPAESPRSISSRPEPHGRGKSDAATRGTTHSNLTKALKDPEVHADPTRPGLASEIDPNELAPDDAEHNPDTSARAQPDNEPTPPHPDLFSPAEQALPASPPPPSAVEPVSTPGSNPLPSQAAKPGQRTPNPLLNEAPTVRTGPDAAVSGPSRAAPGEAPPAAFHAALALTDGLPQTPTVGPGVFALFPRNDLKALTNALPEADAIATSSVPVPINHPEFETALGERIRWFADEGFAYAELKLHPEELGPIQVSLSMENGTASIVLSATHEQTTRAIEAALPKLQGFFEDRGVSLGQVQVAPEGRGNSDPSGQPSQGRHESARRSTKRIHESLLLGSTEGVNLLSTKHVPGRLDLFA